MGPFKVPIDYILPYSDVPEAPHLLRPSRINTCRALGERSHRNSERSRVRLGHARSHAV